MAGEVTQYSPCTWWVSMSLCVDWIDLKKKKDADKSANRCNSVSELTFLHCLLLWTSLLYRVLDSVAAERVSAQAGGRRFTQLLLFGTSVVFVCLCGFSPGTPGYSNLPISAKCAALVPHINTWFAQPLSLRMTGIVQLSRQLTLVENGEVQWTLHTCMYLMAENTISKQ